MSNEPPVLTPETMPDVHEAVLDAAFVRHLLGDIDACAQLHSVTVKHGALQHVDDRPVTLPHAAQQLFDGTARAIQLRYRHQGQEWTDTILRVGDNFRLVRVVALMA